MKRAAHPLALLVTAALVASLAATAQAAFPGRNGRLSYIDDGRVLSGRPGGGHDRALARPSRGAGTSAYKPDGRTILFDTLDDRKGPNPSSALFLKRADGQGHERRLTRPFDPGGRLGEDTQPDWSPDGQSVVFTRGYGSLLAPAIPPRSGRCAAAFFCLRIYHRGRSRALLSEGRGMSSPLINSPTWSVRGWIAFFRDRDIWVIRPDGSGKRRLLHTNTDNPDLDWSPDGRRLVFLENGGALVTIGADGHHLRYLGRYGDEPAYSPDGRRIVYTSTDRHRLWTIDLRGRSRRLVRTRYPAVAPDWQPLPRPTQR